MRTTTERAVAIRDRFHAETGATAVEYGLIIALIAAVIAAVVATLGSSVQASFQHVTDLLP